MTSASFLLSATKGCVHCLRHGPYLKKLLSFKFPQTLFYSTCFRWRKIQKLGLASMYKDQNSEKGQWLHYTFGLSYLNPQDVPDVFGDLVSIQPQDQKLTKFADYITENYIDEEEHALFPPNVWAADSASLWRTTNACESFHSRFNASCESPHPNIFKFLKSLKHEQTDTYIRINSAKNCHIITTDANTKKRQAFLQQKLELLKSGEISKLEFVKCVSYKAAETRT